MNKKRSTTSYDGKPLEGDNLKRITGIGPVAERYLNGVGIISFAQLAALSPADIAAAVSNPTLTTERINKQNWIGQARDLVAKKNLAESEYKRKIDNITLGLTQTASQEGINGALIIPPSVKKSHSGILKLYDLNIKTSDENNRSRVLHNGEPFKAYFILDLTEVRGPIELQHFYKATLYCKSLGKNNRQILGETFGTFTHSERTPVMVEGIAPIQGFYRLEIMVAISTESIELTSHPDLIALIESDPVHFY